MSDNSDEPESGTETNTDESSSQKRERRKIPGNLPYTTTSGVLKSVLEKIPDAEKPSTFNSDFLGTVLGVTGGSGRPIPPIFKTAGLLDQSGAPTELYSQFQTQSGRANAALRALRNGFSEIFKRNQYANRLDEKGLLDIIVTITGLPRTDKVARAILNTFQAFQGFANDAKEDSIAQASDNKQTASPESDVDILQHSKPPSAFGLTYNINIILPDTTNIEVYSAIFRSIRANLLQ